MILKPAIVTVNAEYTTADGWYLLLYNRETGQHLTIPDLTLDDVLTALRETSELRTQVAELTARLDALEGDK